MKLTDEEINDIKTMYGTGHPLVKKMLQEIVESHVLLHESRIEINRIRINYGYTFPVEENERIKDVLEKTKEYE